MLSDEEGAALRDGGWALRPCPGRANKPDEVSQHTSPLHIGLGFESFRLGGCGQGIDKLLDVAFHDLIELVQR